jgi:hypothetical protein
VTTAARGYVGTLLFLASGRVPLRSKHIPLRLLGRACPHVIGELHSFIRAPLVRRIVAVVARIAILVHGA